MSINAHVERYPSTLCRAIWLWWVPRALGAGWIRLRGIRSLMMWITMRLPWCWRLKGIKPQDNGFMQALHRLTPLMFISGPQRYPLRHKGSNRDGNVLLQRCTRVGETDLNTLFYLVYYFDVAIFRLKRDNAFSLRFYRSTYWLRYPWPRIGFTYFQTAKVNWNAGVFCSQGSGTLFQSPCLDSFSILLRALSPPYFTS